MSRPSRESIMTALLNALAASVQVSFTADTQANSVALSNVSSATGLFIGLPVFGVNVPRGTVIASITPLTLSLPASSNARAVEFTTGFLTFGRRFKMWSDVTAQPALFLRDTSETLEYPLTVMQQQTINAEVWIYSKAGENPDIAPVIALNNLLDCVQNAFTPDDPMSQRFTLGGLVHWCRMSGRIEKSPGDLDGQAIAVADVEIIVP